MPATLEPVPVFPVNGLRNYEQHVLSGKGLIHGDEPIDRRDSPSSDINLSIAKISSALKVVLEAVGEDSSREGLLKTPERFAKAMMFFTRGYEQDPAVILRDAVFHENHEGLVLVKDIEFSSLCEHHLVPFIGKMHIGYIPDGKIVGLSKMARVGEAFARRLQVQERLTTEIAHCMFNVLQPRGVAVVIEATHQCMVMRGVQKRGASTTTTCFLGEFDTNRDCKEDFWRSLSSR
ncbi:GTP cyclohydrolase I [Thozetella sp. PMI_491]|nr:GTP cyclohydrolase I [Thozetella sp. PMI_491]